jgi:hypothetical protein
LAFEQFHVVHRPVGESRCLFLAQLRPRDNSGCERKKSRKNPPAETGGFSDQCARSAQLALGLSLALAALLTAARLAALLALAIRILLILLTGFLIGLLLTALLTALVLAALLTTLILITHWEILLDCGLIPQSEQSINVVFVPVPTDIRRFPVPIARKQRRGTKRI